jgi:hypothetical protein
MVDEIKRLSDDEILKGDIESMAADFAAKHQIKLPVLEEEFECSPPSLTPGNAPVTVRVEIPFEGEKDLFACYGHCAPVIYERFAVDRPLTLAAPPLHRRHTLMRKGLRTLLKG